MIENCSFGLLVVNGRRYTSDLLIYPDGRVVDSWYRKRGHRLSIDDISELVESEPEVIIAGTGASGLVKPDKELEELLQERGIKFIPAPNHRAMELYNELPSKTRVGACFHLTC